MSEILDARKTQIFETTPIPKAVVTLAVPAIIGQAITIIYNLADKIGRASCRERVF